MISRKLVVRPLLITLLVMIIAISAFTLIPGRAYSGADFENCFMAAEEASRCTEEAGFANFKLEQELDMEEVASKVDNHHFFGTGQ